MQLVSIISMIIYFVFFLLYFRKIFQPKRSHWLFYVAAVAINISAILISNLLDIYLLRVFLYIGSMWLSFKLLFYGNRLQILYAGSIYMFSLYSTRGIIASIYSMVLHDSINEIFQQNTYYNTILVLSILVTILLNLFIRKVVMPDSTTSHMIYNRGQLKFMDIYLLLQLIFLLLVNDGRFFEVRQYWFSALYLMSCVISKLGLQVVINHTAKVAELLEYELHTRQLQEQLSRQMRHYQSYHRFTESYRAFRHDYKNMMTSVKTLLCNQEYEQAARMLDSIHDTMQKDIQIHKTYSNNILLDAILQDAANTCEEKGIRFSAVAHLPESISLGELDIVRVFANVIDNAIEACDKISDSERFIEITSGGNQDWALIEVSNSINGELLLKDDELKTTKDSTAFHGLGLRIIRQTIEGIGGRMLIEPNQKKRIFIMKLYFPKAL